MLIFVYIVISPLLLLSLALTLMPSRALCALGRGLGRLLKFVGFRTRIVANNLEMTVAKEMSAQEVRALEIKIFENIGLTFLQILRNFTVSRKRAIKELYVSDENLKLLDQFKIQKKGLVALSAHISCWELFPVGMAARGYPVSAVVKRISSKFYQAFVEHRRTSAGFEVIYSGNTLVKMNEAINNGQFVGFMMDQHIGGKSAIETTFFGARASSIKGLAQLARDSGCIILPMCVYRKSDGTHELFIDEPLKFIHGVQFPENSQERLDYEIQANSQHYQDAVEKLVRKNMEQWLWIHRRWKLAGQKQS